MRVFSVAGGADPGRGAERLSERLFGWEPAANQWFRSHYLEGCGLSAKCENRGQRPQLQWRRRRLIWVLVWVFSLAPALAQSHGFDIIHPTPDPE